MEDEDEGEELEDVLAVRLAAAVPAAPAPAEDRADRGPEGAEGEEGPDPVAVEDETAAGTGPAPAAAEARAPAEGWGEAPGADGAQDSGAWDSAGEAGTALWPDGPVRPAMRRDGGAALERAQAGDGRSEAPALARDEDGAAVLDAAARAAQDGETGIQGLYRQVVRAARPALQPPAGGPEARAARPLEAERPRALTVDELDRAVRRDSWRYDGGMTLF